MILLVMLGVVGWLAVLLVVDRRHVPAWRIANFYRATSGVFFLLLLIVTLKALMWYVELKAIIPYCK